VRTQIEAALKSVPLEEWQIKQIVALGWYDGPIFGLCELERPQICFCFNILGQRFDDAWSDRLFRLGDAPPDAVEQAIAALQDLGPPRSPSWAPIWRFSSEEAEHETNRRIDEILASVTPTDIIVRAIHMEQFLGYWYDVSETEGLGGKTPTSKR
jgi:hypothetical protein